MHTRREIYIYIYIFSLCYVIVDRVPTRSWDVLPIMTRKVVKMKGYLRISLVNQKSNSLLLCDFLFYSYILRSCDNKKVLFVYSSHGKDR